ncbi:hypothetical protein PAXRUDRAFT_823691, partial [Paxillus rubicundulus Ve08.2h10]
MSLEEHVQGMAKEVTIELGGPDVMVADAAVAQVLPLAPRGWEYVMTVNTRGLFLCCKYTAGQTIKQRRGGRIIGASSLAGKTGLLLTSAYPASKFAVRGLTQAAALELGRCGITVNAYAPGVIATAMTANTIGADGNFLSSDEESAAWVANYFEGRPIKHTGKSDDIANIVSYLASKEAHSITGIRISVDGGIY